MREKVKATIKSWAIMAAVFVLGGITGISIHGIYRARTSASSVESRSHDRAAMFAKMREDLDLTDEQSKEMRRVLDETGNDFRALRAELRPRYEELRLKARARMRALLTPEQQQKFDALMMEIDAKRQRGEAENKNP